MNKTKFQTFHHVCPRNCPSSCTMWSYVDNNQVKHITGDSSHSYTNGKLCQKGFSYIEQNYHNERLKYPYYQKVKGSGKFKPISWNKAYELITNELLNIHKGFSTFLPFALYKGTGNIGLHHNVVERFFAGLDETSRIIGASSLMNHPKRFEHLWKRNDTHPDLIEKASIIVIWGANPAVSDIHLIPFLIRAKMNGTKIVVIDSLLTKTVEFADVFVQLRPKTDQTLSYIIMRTLIDYKQCDSNFIKEHTSGFKHFYQSLQSMNMEEAVKQCDIPAEALEQLLSLFKTNNSVAYIVGKGILKHSNWKETIHAIEALAVIRGDMEKEGGGLFYRHQEERLVPHSSNDNQRLIYLDKLSYYTSTQNNFPIEMLWISCGNPLIQELDPETFKRFMQDVPFVVTVDRFMTPTALMSNLVLPTTSHFEETDIIINDWHFQMAFNEAAISPYADSKSEWTIMTELTRYLKDQTTLSVNFPIYSSEETFLNAQLNNTMLKNYDIKNLTDLKKVNKVPYMESERIEPSRELYQFDIQKRLIDEFNSQKHTTNHVNAYPFWLITPKHPYMFNSQFHYLKLFDENEAFIGINPKIAKQRNIRDGEVIRVYSSQDTIEIKALYSYRVPNDIMMFYQGWYPSSDVSINRLMSHYQDADENNILNHKFAFYDTFVNFEKL